jgi:hypothetical protein
MYLANGVIDQIVAVAPVEGEPEKLTVYVQMDTPHTGVITLQVLASSGGLALGPCRVQILEA